MGEIRVGIGGWNFAPWRGVFYPPGLKQADELEFAGRAVTAIEINATFYRTQSAASFRRWRDATPEDFVFALKGPRGATYIRDLAEAGRAVDRFLGSGILELGGKLGPLLWQFPPTRRFEADTISTFLDALPAERDGISLRHVIEGRHGSFADPAFPALLRARGIAPALVESEKHPLVEDDEAPFVYARLERSAENEPAGYALEALDGWAEKAKAWARRRDAFVFFISGAKVRNPAAAQALLRRLRNEG
jgi:uncharacterized protein YecE (DUF72 family)